MLEINNRPLDTVAIEAVFNLKASARVGHPVKLRPEQSLRIMSAALTSGIPPEWFVNHAFDSLDEEACLSIFGISYPPAEYVASECHRRFAARERSWAKKIDKGVIASLRKALQEDQMARMMARPGLISAIVTGTLSPMWVNLVKQLPDHPLYAVTERASKHLPATTNTIPVGSYAFVLDEFKRVTIDGNS